MELNLINIFYLFFRLSPFIIVCFFTLSSIINQDIKAFVYLVGLIAACFINFLIGNVFTSFISIPESPPVCNIFTIGDASIPAKMPFGICILGYSFFYMVYVITKYNLALYNIPTLILFPILIIGDFLWNLNNFCYGLLAIFISFAVGSLIGLGWAWILVEYMKSPQVHYVGMFTNAQICSRPAATTFKCTYVGR
jgi:hypothetical protein